MKRAIAVALAGAAFAMAGIAQAQSPELATQSAEDPNAVPAKPVFKQDSMNVFRRFPQDITDQMVKFYNDAVGLKALTPIQLTKTQRMLLFRVGATGQIKLAAGLTPGRDYKPGGDINATTGIRLLTFTYPDANEVTAAFKAAGFDAPKFKDIGGGRQAALVKDPGGFNVELLVDPNATEAAQRGVGVGINTSDLAKSRAFYRDFVGLEELPPVKDPVLGVTRYPFRNGETTVSLWSVGKNLPADTGSAGIQYVIGNIQQVNAAAKQRGLTVQTPLGGIRGFPGLLTVWLNDPDGATDYFYQMAGRPPARQ
jgi:catechol 2,3-dioxygenase-like lactoylglutathione lyase family enzyme